MSCGRVEKSEYLKLPVSVSQRMIWPSSLAVAQVLPSGLKAAAVIGLR